MITYNGVIAAAGNSYDISSGQWRAKAPDYQVMVVGLVPPSNYNTVLDAAVVMQAFRVSPYDNRAHVEARLENRCGWSDWADIEYFRKSCLGNPGSGGIWFSYSPNPVTDELTITFEDLPAETDLTETYTVKLIDHAGKTQRESKFKHHRREGKSKTVKFNMSDLKEDTYYLHVESGGKIEKVQIVVWKP